jgi:hypothetical protein
VKEITVLHFDYFGVRVHLAVFLLKHNSYLVGHLDKDSTDYDIIVTVSSKVAYP